MSHNQQFGLMNWTHVSLLLAIAAVLCNLQVTSASNILVLHPMHSPSHVLALRTLALEMVARGHQVTIVRPHDHQLPPIDATNITELTVNIDNTDGTIPFMSAESPAQFQMPMKLMWQRGTSVTAVPFEGFLAVSAYCHHLLSDSNLAAKLNSTTFHLAVVDLLVNECSLALAHSKGLPVVGYWPCTFSGFQPHYTTAFNPPSATPMIASHFTDRMTFFQRLWNHVLLGISDILMRLLFVITNYQIRTHLPNAPHPAELLSNLSGLLINVHPAIDYPRLLPPTFLEVGGFHIHPNKSLPSNLGISDSRAKKSGVILFSLGSTFDSKLIPSEIIFSYLKAFGRLPQKVIMVVKGSMSEHEIPENVQVVQWVPQADVLAHPHTLLFVTHCGMHGVLEALTYGVPMVGIPVFGDQEDVLVRLKEKEVAVGIGKHSTADQLHAALVEVLNNTKYRENALKLSKILHDRLAAPMDSAAWLLEHTIRTGGAQYLKLASRHLNIWQYLGLDVALFLLVALCFVGTIALKVIVWCFVRRGHGATQTKLKTS